MVVVMLVVVVVAAVDTSFIFHPTYGARVSVFSLPPLSPPPPTSSSSFAAWRHLGHSHSLLLLLILLLVPLSFFRSRSVAVSIAPAARGNPCSLPSPFVRPRSLPLFLFVSPIFRLLPRHHHLALPLYPPTSLLPRFSSLLPLSFRLNRVSGIFWQLFRRASFLAFFFPPFSSFFVPKRTCHILVSLARPPARSLLPLLLVLQLLRGSWRLPGPVCEKPFG